MNRFKLTLASTAIAVSLAFSSMASANLIDSTATDSSGTYTIVDIGRQVDEQTTELVVAGIAKAKETNTRLLLTINNYGGSVFNMNEVVFLMKNSGVKVDTLVYGTAASAATTIAMHGDRRFITPSASYLTHLGSIQLGSAAVGSQDLTNVENYFNASNRAMVEEYIRITGLTREEVEKKLLTPGVDHAFSPTEVLAFHFADEIVDSIADITQR